MTTLEQLPNNLSVAARFRAYLQDQGYLGTEIQAQAGLAATPTVATDVTTPTMAGATVSDQNALLSPTAPSWAREVGLAYATRPSRASSIISTRTRFSTTTLQDDTRSIDINLGGQLFRISRDGTRITSDVPPPPYSGPASPPIPEETSQEGSMTASSITVLASGNPQSTSDLRANITDPTEVDIPSPIEPSLSRLSSQNRSSVDDGLPSRNPSYTRGTETITVADAIRQRRTVSQNDLPGIEHTESSWASPLKRRNGIRLPTIVTSQPASGAERGLSPVSGSAIKSGASTHHLHTQSAGPSLPSGQQMSPAAHSPTYIGRNATGLFPSSQYERPALNARSLAKGKELSRSILRNVSNDASQPDEEAEPEAEIGSDANSENEISTHYTRMIRFIDHDHRRIVHNKDKELAGLRERLNEVDQVYRQELKARDFTIDDLKKRLSHLEENTEVMLERARNEVEDVWEKRWKQQEYHLMERLRRLEIDSQKNDRLYGT